MKRRIFSVLLALCMLLTLVPTTAFATTDITIDSQEDWDNLIANCNTMIPATGGRVVLNVDVIGDLRMMHTVNDLIIDGGSGQRIDGMIHSEKTIDLTLKNLEIHATTGDKAPALSFWKASSLTTEGTVVLAGGSGWSRNGIAVSCSETLTITASDTTTFVGGDNSQYGNAISADNLVLNGGSPTFKAGNNCSYRNANHGAKLSADLTISSGSPTFIGGKGYGNLGMYGALIYGNLIISSDGSPKFIAADGIGNDNEYKISAYGAWIGRHLRISAGTPEFRGGAASGSESAGAGVYAIYSLSISGTASPKFIGGNGTAEGKGGLGAIVDSDTNGATIAGTGTSTFTAGANGTAALKVGRNGTGPLNLANLGGIFKALGVTKAFFATPTYPEGLDESLKYDNTAAEYVFEKKLSLTYDGNGSEGGTVPVDQNSPYKAGAEVTVLAKGDLFKTDYVFAGWNTEADGSGDSYAAGDTFAMPGNNVTLYAQWSPPWHLGDIETINSIIEDNHAEGMTPATAPYGFSVPGDWEGKVVWNGAEPKRITRLDLSGRGMDGTLDVKDLTKLEQLNCGTNQLTGLELSGLSALKTLSCNSNQLTALNVSELSALTDLNCSDNRLPGLALNADANYSSIKVQQNYMAGTEAVTGKEITWDNTHFIFEPQKTAYSVNVINGTPSITRAMAGNTVTLVANDPEFSYEFKGWTFSPDITLTEGTSKTDTTVKFEMPAGDLTATAEIEAIKYNITAVDCTADPSPATYGQTVTLTANEPPAKQKFKSWYFYPTPELVDGFDITDNPIQIKMLAESIKATAKYEMITYPLTVNNGWAQIGYAYPRQAGEGQQVSIIAAGAPDGQRFKNWTVNSDNVTLNDANASTTYFTMPGAPVEVTANYEDIPEHEITVHSGTADPNPGPEGAKITITAADPPNIGWWFKNWTVNSGNATLNNINAATTTFTMPTGPVEVTANYQEVEAQSVTVNSGQTDKETALTGETVTITADPAPIDGQAFNKWTVNSGGITLKNVNLATTTFKMGPNPVVVTASYGDPPEYHPEDIAVINSIVEAHPELGWSKAPANGSSVPGKWENNVTWNDSVPSRVEELDLSFLGLEGTLEVSGLPALVKFECWTNNPDGDLAGLRKLNVSNLPLLEEIDCSINDITEINLSNLPALTELKCKDNQLTEIDVSGLTALENLYCDYNNLAELDVSALSNLETLDCSFNQLTQLNVSGLSHLNELDCRGNQLSELVLNSNFGRGYSPALNVSGNYMADRSAVSGVFIEWDGEDFVFDPQCKRISVVNGTADPAMAFTDMVVTITADAAPGGESFKEWVIFPDVTFTEGSKTSQTVKFKMPAEEVFATATYEGVPSTDFAIKMNGGAADPSPAVAGTTVTVTADDPGEGQRFKSWTVDSGNVILDNPKAANTAFTMPAAAVELTANYENIPGTVYALTVHGGTVSPNPAMAGETVVIMAGRAPGGQQFKNWTVNSGNVTLSNANAEKTSFKMPAAVVEITANYEEIPTSAYNTGDIAIINGIIEAQGLNWGKAPTDGSSVPDAWEDRVVWTTNATNKRVRELDFSWEDLAGSLDLSGLTMLTKLDCNKNELTSLDVSGLPYLYSIYCSSNLLTELDASNLMALEYLYCSNNELNELNLSGSADLIRINCDDNQLTALNLSDLDKLRHLQCSYNRLDELDISACTALLDLKCSGNLLSELDVSACTDLLSMTCYYNQLTNLNISSLTKLKFLDCSYNQIAGSLDLSNMALTDLYCEYNQLTGLNVSGCTALETLWCFYNKLAALDFGGCTALATLRSHNNMLTGLDARGLTSLYNFQCNDNKLATLQVNGLAELFRLDCSCNCLTGLDISGTSDLSLLDVSRNLIENEDKVTGKEITWDGTNFIFFPQYAEYQDITFTVKQLDGASGTADSSGIEITFDKPVENFSKNAMWIGGITGDFKPGDLTGSGTTWTLAIAQVLQEGDIELRISNFENYRVSKDAQRVTVYKHEAQAGVSIDDIADQEYTGAQIKPAVTVRAEDKILTEGIDYTVSYGINKAVGANSGFVTVKAKENGNYTFANLTKRFNIVAKATDITIDDPGTITYDGAPVEAIQSPGTADIVYNYNGDGAVTVAWYADRNGAKGDALGAAPANAGTYWVGVSAATGTNYGAVAEVTKQFVIRPRALTVDDFTMGANPIYDGSEKAAPINSAALNTPADYTLGGATRLSDVQAAAVNVSATGTGNYTGTVSFAWNLEKANLTMAAAVDEKIYDGTTAATINKGALTGVIPADVANVSVAQATVAGNFADAYAGNDKTVTMAGNFTLTGSKAGNYTLTQPGGLKGNITAAPDPANIVAAASVIKGGAVDLSNNVTGAKGDVTYAITTALAGCAVDANSGKFTAGGTTGTCTVTVTVAAKSVGGDANNEYSGKTGDIIVTVSDKYTESLVVSQTGCTYGDILANPTYTRPNGCIAQPTITYQGERRGGGAYPVSDIKPTDAGTYKVTVRCETADTIYEGTSAEFSIAPKNISGAVVTLGEDLTYNTGLQIQAVMKVELAAADISVFCEISDNTGTDAGKYTLKVTAKDKSNYTGSVNKDFTIAKKDITPTIIVTGTYTYDGNPKNPAYTVSDGETNLAASDYTAVLFDNTKAGNGKISVTAKPGGNYAFDEATENFIIEKAAAPVLNKIDTTQKYTVNTERTKAIGRGGMPANAGALGYEKSGQDKTGALTIDAWAVDASGKVTYTLSGGEVGDTATLTVKISSDNYADASVDVVITLTDKDKQAEPRYTRGLAFAAIPANDGSVSINYTESNGSISLEMSDKKVQELIDKSVGGVAEIDVSGVKNATSAEMPKEALAALGDADLAVTIELPAGNITLNQEAVDSIAGQLKGDKVSVELLPVKTDSLSDTQKQAVKANDVIIDINIRSGAQKISEFKGELEIQIPYSGPQPVAVWYLNEAGELEKVNCSFANGRVTFHLNHLSLYVLGQDTGRQEKWTNPFNDVKEKDWFYSAVKFACENKLMNGVGNDLFAPHGVTTRGMIVTMLHRLEGNTERGSPEPKAANPFVDVAGNKYYSQAVVWAAENKIVSGYGGGKFGPDDYITREQMATIFMNYAKYKGCDTAARAEIDKFTDSSKISQWAKDAMAWANAEALILGDGAKLNPADKAERCQAATIFMRFIKNVSRSEKGTVRM